MKHFFTIIATMAMAGTLCSCFEDVVDYTVYNTAIYCQANTNGSYVPAQEVETYAFYADTTEWRVASLEDALAHRITNKLTGEVKSDPDAFGSFNASQQYQSSIRLEQPMSMIVMVLPQHGIYAYRNYALPENLAQVDTKFYIALWRPSHNSAGWRIVNPGYTPSTE